MTNAPMQILFDRQTQVAGRERRIRQLAEGLMAAVGITTWWKDWVIWLTDTPVKNNRDAMECWVTKQLKDPTLPVEDQAIVLKRRLIARLEAVREVSA